jgi:hypothetical protein
LSSLSLPFLSLASLPSLPSLHSFLSGRPLDPARSPRKDQYGHRYFFRRRRFRRPAGRQLRFESTCGKAMSHEHQESSALSAQIYAHTRIPHRGGGGVNIDTASGRVE